MQCWCTVLGYWGIDMIFEKQLFLVYLHIIVLFLEYLELLYGSNHRSVYVEWGDYALPILEQGPKRPSARWSDRGQI